MIRVGSRWGRRCFSKEQLAANQQRVEERILYDRSSYDLRLRAQGLAPPPPTLGPIVGMTAAFFAGLGYMTWTQEVDPRHIMVEGPYDDGRFDYNTRNPAPKANPWETFEYTNETKTVYDENDPFFRKKSE